MCPQFLICLQSSVEERNKIDHARFEHDLTRNIVRPYIQQSAKFTLL